MATRRPTSAPYRCTECGWTTPKWAGRCGECQQWGTVVEAAEQTGILHRVTPIAPSADRAAQPITRLSTAEAPRRTTGVGEFDRVLGGGVVPGAAILLSGEPGVGKSTLLLEVAAQSARAGRRVLYASAEESTAQVRLRAERTGALHDELYLAAETDLATILGHVDEVRPELLIVDSVQTVSSGLSEGMAGHPSQVREVASTLIRIAKDRGLPVIIVGHVTKDGSIAGPRILEHLVDVVCQFEGDRQTSLRFIRALKNRFGPTDEVGCFDMTGAGIAEVPDPSALFLGHGDPVAGTCVTIALEGRRAMPVEVQALTIKNGGPNPRRIVSGVDAARVAMVLAVLERRADIKVSGSRRVRVHGRRCATGGAGRRPRDRHRRRRRHDRPPPAPRRRRDRRAEPRRRGAPRDAGGATPRRSRATRISDGRGCLVPLPQREHSATSAPAGGRLRRRVCRSSESLLPLVDSCGRLLP